MRYLFLIAWIDGSESAMNSEEPYTKVRRQDDLLPQWMLKNEAVFAVEVFAPCLEIATAFGCQSAFHNNYTGYDTLSLCLEMDNARDAISGMVVETIRVEAEFKVSVKTHKH